MTDRPARYLVQTRQFGAAWVCYATTQTPEDAEALADRLADRLARAVQVRVSIRGAVVYDPREAVSS